MLEFKATPGQQYVVKRVLNSQNHDAYRRKLLAMGLTPGALIRVLRVAPLGDPVQFEVNGFSLSLRHHELNHFLELEAVDG